MDQVLEIHGKGDDVLPFQEHIAIPNVITDLSVRFAAVDERVDTLIPEKRPIALVDSSPCDVLQSWKIATLCLADPNLTHLAVRVESTSSTS